MKNALTISVIVLSLVHALPAVARQLEPWEADYTKRVEALIQKNWHPPKRSAYRKVKVSFKIWRSGKVAAVTVLHSSGDERMDKAAVAAVREAGILPPIPPESSKTQEKMTMTFEYKARGSSHSSD